MRLEISSTENDYAVQGVGIPMLSSPSSNLFSVLIEGRGSILKRATVDSLKSIHGDDPVLHNLGSFIAVHVKTNFRRIADVLAADCKALSHCRLQSYKKDKYTMIRYPASTVRKHMVIAAEPAPVSLISKQCPCGTRITARQLAQHGTCEHCRLTSGLEAGDLDKLRFMLGATPHHAKSRWGFRNHYLCNVQDLAAMQRLELAGLAVAGALLLQLRYFHATSEGCRAAGLSRARAQHALKARP